MDILRFRKSSSYFGYRSIRIPFNSILMIFYCNLHTCLFDVYGLFKLFMALEVYPYRISQVIGLYGLGMMFIVTSFILLLELGCDLFAGDIVLLFD